MHSRTVYINLYDIFEQSLTVNPRHNDTLKEGNDENDTTTGVVVEQLKHVHSSLQI